MEAELAVACIASPIAFAAGNLYVSNLISMEGDVVMHLTDAAVTLPAYLVQGGSFSGEPIALCVGFLLVCAIWIAYARHLLNAARRDRFCA